MILSRIDNSTWRSEIIYPENGWFEIITDEEGYSLSFNTGTLKIQMGVFTSFINAIECINKSFRG